VKTVELTQDEIDLITALVRQQAVGVASPEALRVLTTYQSILKKLTEAK